MICPGTGTASCFLSFPLTLCLSLTPPSPILPAPLLYSAAIISPLVCWRLIGPLRADGAASRPRHCVDTCVASRPSASTAPRAPGGGGGGGGGAGPAERRRRCRTSRLGSWSGCGAGGRAVAVGGRRQRWRGGGEFGSRAPWRCAGGRADLCAAEWKGRDRAWDRGRLQIVAHLLELRRPQRRLSARCTRNGSRV